MWMAILAGLLAAIVVIVLFMRRGEGDKATATGTNRRPAANTSAPSADSDALPYDTEETQNVAVEGLKIAFGVARTDYNIMGEHAQVLASVAESLEESVHQREYFPRRPMQLPKLLQAINDSESTRAELVRLILEDPTLAGTVLQRANSAFYRVSPAPVENLDRAVFLLGTDGLRGLMAAAILQPVFRVPRGYFEAFADSTWEQAERISNAAETCARQLRNADPFVTQLLSMLTMLANIVVFRLTMDKYRDHPNVLPRAEVFIAAIQAHRARMASLIASTWQLSDPSMVALQEREQRVSPAQMSPVGRCIYYGELCGALALLESRKVHSRDGAFAILKQQGLSEADVLTLWQAATAFERQH